MSIWTCGIWITISLSSIRNIKRNLFPCTEFRIGQNIRIEEKMKNKKLYICYNYFNYNFRYYSKFNKWFSFLIHISKN